MNLRNNKGFTEIDISVSIIIILLFIPLMFGLIYNIGKTNNVVKRQTQALSILTSVLEITKDKDLSFDKIDIANSEFIGKMQQKYTKIDNSNYIYSIENKEQYKINIIIEPYPEDVVPVLVKKFTVKVAYPDGNETKDIQISTVLQRK